MGQDESIEFLAKYKDWIAIKKMSIKDDTKPEEVAFHLASIRQSVDRKAFEILGIDVASLDALAEKLLEGARKSYSGLGEAIGKLGDKEVREAVAAAAKKEELQSVAGAYLLRKIINGLGFDADVNQEMLSKAYPYLKIRKPLGRQKKQ